MRQIIVKGKHLKTLQVWFCTDLNDLERGGYDKVIIHGYPSVSNPMLPKDSKYSEQETLITDLTISEEDLWKKTNKTVRNEVRRSKRENTKIDYYSGSSINNSLLSDFSDMYENMYREKEITNIHLPINELVAYNNECSLLISTASIDGKVVVFHSYIFDDTHSRFLHSCSEFRVESKELRNAIGRANKLLHWSDWMNLKQRGITSYDWGGIASYETPNGIDKFKLSFGGDYLKYYNINYNCSLLAKINSIIRS